MEEGAIIHDVYVSVSWPILVFIATVVLLFFVVVVLWARRR
jgi:hypothetical protein